MENILREGEMLGVGVVWLPSGRLVGLGLGLGLGFTIYDVWKI